MSITVCDKCLRASCFQGIFLCEFSQTAGSKIMSMEDLNKLCLEDCSYWKDGKRNFPKVDKPPLGKSTPNRKG